MSTFDTNDIKPRNTKKSPQSGNNCDIFEPSVYTPDNSKYRADYIKNLSAKIADVIAYVDEEEGIPSVDVILTGDPTNRTIEFRFHNLKGASGSDTDVSSIVQLIENIQRDLSNKASNTDLTSLRELVYSLHATGGHIYSPTLYFKNSNPTLYFEAKIKIGSQYVEITSSVPHFAKGNVVYYFTKKSNSTSKIHKYEFIDGNNILDDSINNIDVEYSYEGPNGIGYNGTVRYKGVSVVYYGKSSIASLTQASAQDLINTMNKVRTPVESIKTTTDIYNISIDELEVQDEDTAPYFYFAIPEDVTLGSKFYVKGGSPQYASDLVNQGSFIVNVDDDCGIRSINYRFYRSSARQGAGNFTIYII